MYTGLLTRTKKFLSVQLEQTTPWNTFKNRSMKVSGGLVDIKYPE